jgi:hypothetical protein
VGWAVALSFLSGFKVAGWILWGGGRGCSVDKSTTAKVCKTFATAFRAANSSLKNFGF